MASSSWLALTPAAVVGEHAGEAPVLLDDLLDGHVGVLGPLVQHARQDLGELAHDRRLSRAWRPA
jgi:hypothetical protein